MLLSTTRQRDVRCVFQMAGCAHIGSLTLWCVKTGRRDVKSSKEGGIRSNNGDCGVLKEKMNDRFSHSGITVFVKTECCETVALERHQLRCTLVVSWNPWSE